MDAQLRRFYIAAAGIFLATIALSLLWRSAVVTVGAATGVLVSVVPWASWHFIISATGARGGGRKAVVVTLILVKYAAVAGLLWALFRFGLADLAGVAAGLVAGSLSVLIVAFSGER